MTSMARNICTRVVCLVLPPLLLILAFKPILFHTIVMDGHYMLCSIEDILLVENNNAKSTSPAVRSGKTRRLLSRTAASNLA